jgi:DNA-binding FadR family transcriptional regulator
MASPEDPAGGENMFGVLNRPRAFEEIIDQIEQAIIAGRLNPGDRLPAERELSEIFGVSRSSVREALRVLEMFGALVTTPGRGRTSGSIVAAGASSGLRNALRLHTALLKIPLRDVISIRVAVEMQSARDAARAATDDDCEKLHSLNEQILRAGSAREANTIDTRFHAELARASGNGFTPALVEGIREAMIRDLLKGFTALDDWREEFDVAAAEHEEILGHVERRDGDAAALAMRGHIVRLFESISAASSEPGGLDLSQLSD